MPGRGAHPGAGQPDLPGGPEVLLRVSACRGEGRAGGGGAVPGLPPPEVLTRGAELSEEATVDIT